MLSAIVPVFNCEKYIVRCINSIIQQKTEDHELIIVDDGSSDNSSVLIDEYAFKNSNLIIVHKNNKGPSSARNAGLALSSADHIVFIDSDDYISHNYFATIDCALDSYKCDILIYGMSSSVSKTVPKINCIVTGHENVIGYYEKTWDTIDYYSCCNKVFSGRMLRGNHIRFNEKTTVEEDFIFNLNALDCANSLSLITDILYFYDQKETGSLTTSYNPKRFEGKIVSFQEEIRLLTKWGLVDAISYQNNQMISFVSVLINNLLYDDCTLSYSDKINEIEKYFSLELVKKSLSNTKNMSLRTQIMSFFIHYHLYNTAYITHYMIKKLRGYMRKNVQ